jgi:hypothetical protein
VVTTDNGCWFDASTESCFESDEPHAKDSDKTTAIAKKAQVALVNRLAFNSFGIN